MKLLPTMTACAVACLALTAVLASGAPSTTPGAQKSRLGKSIDGYLTRCEANGWSGAVLVAKDGKVVLAQGYGMADREAGRKVGADTLFEIASATKPFTACAIMKLVEQSRLGLDDPISKHLPGVPADKQDITIRHLLTHTSGMPRSAAGGRGEDLDRAVAGYLGVARSRASGAVCEYWNGGYALLAGVVEVASGKSYTEYCEEHIFGPAGMEDTGFAGDTDLDRARQAMGYDEDRAVRLAAEHAYGSYGYQYRGMGGMVTSVNDLWKFIQAWGAGQILSPESVALMETAAIGHQGLGWSVIQTSRNTRQIGHGGDVKGFHTKFYRFPDEGAAVVVLSNVEDVPLHAVSGALEAQLFGGKGRYPSPPALAELKGRDLDKLVGTYRAEKGHGRIKVERQGQVLRIARFGGEASPQRPGVPPFERIPSEALQVQDGLKKEIAIAELIVDAVQGKDAEKIRSVLMEGIPGSWPGMLVSQIWPKQVRTHGELTGSKVVGAETIGKGRVQVIVELTHEKRPRQLKLVLQDKRLNIFHLEEGGDGAATLESAIDIAGRALEAAVDGDVEYLESILLSGIPLTWPGMLVSTYWPGHVDKYGALESHEILSAKSVGAERYEILIGLAHKKEDRALKVVIDGNRLNIFDLTAVRSELAETFRPISKTEFTKFEWVGSTRVDTVVFDVSGRKVKGLEWRPRKGPASHYARED